MMLFGSIEALTEQWCCWIDCRNDALVLIDTYFKTYRVSLVAKTKIVW